MKQKIENIFFCFTGTIFLNFQPRSGEMEDCIHPHMPCDEDTCVDPVDVCDGKADCQDGTDEREIFCTDL